MITERFYLFENNKVRFYALLITIDCRGKRFGEYIQNNYEKNLKKSRRSIIEMVRKSEIKMLRQL